MDNVSKDAQLLLTNCALTTGPSFNGLAAPFSIDEERQGGGHTVQSVTEEVLVTYLELSRASWDFLVPMDLSRPPNNILIKIL